MFHLETSTAKASRMIARLLTAMLVAATLLAAVGAGRAGAMTAKTSLCPGSVEAPTINGYQSLSGPYFEFPKRIAWRSPCYSAYTQIISLRYRLFRKNLQTGQWGDPISTVRRGSVSPSYSGLSAGAWSGLAPGSNISGDVLVEWRLTNGALIGSTYIDYDATSDYRCLTTLGCGVYSDPIVGAALWIRGF
jgi:hypothetical protein